MTFLIMHLIAKKTEFSYTIYAVRAAAGSSALCKVHLVQSSAASAVYDSIVSAAQCSVVV
jgi:hypothetical protein